MEAFLATLASVSVTILAILAASYAAYAVFFNQQAAKFDDLIAENKVTIRERLLTMRTQWGGSQAYFLNPEFKDKYRARLGGMAGAAFVNKAASDLVFSGEEMKRALSDVRATDTMPGPEQGRVYLWSLNEAVVFVTRSIEQTPAPSIVFPSSASGAGFDEWRKDFEEVLQAFGMLELIRQPMLQDFGQFLAQPERKQNAAAGPFAQTAVSNVFADIATIKRTLNDIDKQSLLKRPYSLQERTHGAWMLLLVALAFITGVLVPTGLLAANMKQSTIAGVSLLAATVVLSVGAVTLFGWDVLHVSEVSKTEYARSRWRTPLLGGLKEANARLDQGGLINRDLFLDARSSRESASFPDPVRRALDNYNESTDAYNQAALALSLRILDVIRADKKLSARLVPPGAQSWSGVGLTPLQILRSQTVNGVAKSLKQNPQQAISFEVQMPTWSRVVAFVPPSSIATDNEALFDRLREIAEEFKTDPLKRHLDDALQRAASSSRELENALKDWA
jgi:hypothetical protein